MTTLSDHPVQPLPESLPLWTVLWFFIGADGKEESVHIFAMTLEDANLVASHGKPSEVIRSEVIEHPVAAAEYRKWRSLSREDDNA